MDENLRLARQDRAQGQRRQIRHAGNEGFCNFRRRTEIFRSLDLRLGWTAKADRGQSRDVGFPKRPPFLPARITRGEDCCCGRDIQRACGQIAGQRDKAGGEFGSGVIAERQRAILRLRQSRVPCHVRLGRSGHALPFAKWNQGQRRREARRKNDIALAQQSIDHAAAGLDRGKHHQDVIQRLFALRTQMRRHRLRERDFPGVQDDGRWLRRHGGIPSKNLPAANRRAGENALGVWALTMPRGCSLTSLSKIVHHEMPPRPT